MRRLPRQIAVIHLPPLPGSPGQGDRGARETLRSAEARAVAESIALVRAGFDGLIIENFGDTPFYKDRVPPITLAAMTVCARAVAEASRIPIGINVLRNDALAALAMAVAVGADFIRVNVLSGVYATDQGLIEGNAAGLLRERDRIGAKVSILADVHVKHARPWSSSSIELAVEENALRAGADAVIVTGSTTGRSVNDIELEKAAASAAHCRVPIYVGSGVTPENVSTLLNRADGVIVSSCLRRNGRAGMPLDIARVNRFIRSGRAGTA